MLATTPPSVSVTASCGFLGDLSEPQHFDKIASMALMADPLSSAGVLGAVFADFCAFISSTFLAAAATEFNSVGLRESWNLPIWTFVPA